MAANEIHKGDIGTQFTVTVQDGTTVVDISTASTKQLIFKKPGGTILTKSTSFVTDGTDGKMQYVSVDGDLSDDGVWKMQGKVIIGGNTFSTDITSFKVYRNLS
jgi:hypothetical protein